MIRGRGRGATEGRVPHLFAHSISDQFSSEFCRVRAIEDRDLALLLEESHGVLQGKKKDLILP
jgi:hypothetical protein